jgi:adenylate kinase
MAYINTLQEDSIKRIKEWLKTGSINIFGLPFSGKDTQGGRLARALDAVLLGGGDILRSGTHESVKKVINTGKLAPTEEYLRIVLPYLSRPEFDNKPLILSSVGRGHGEEPGVIEATSKSNHNLKAVIFLKIDEQAVRERWQAQDASAGHNRGTRYDDGAKALEVRLDEFRNKTLPVIEFYREKGLLIEVDGNTPADDVFNEVVQKLLKLARA